MEGFFNPFEEDETTDGIDDFNCNLSDQIGLRSSHVIPCKNLFPERLPSEPQEGNVEYKLKLVNPNGERFKRLVSQMQWRLREGFGEAIYEIGVEDCGRMVGLSEDEMLASMRTLNKMASQLGASLTVIRKKDIKCDKGCKQVAEVLVRKVPDDQYSIEIRVAVVGNSDVGKSTLLGVLTRGILDNGRGCARLNVFRHRHEVFSGKTSSISLQMMGFDAEGHVVDQTCTRSRDYDDEDICKKSSKIINFIDLAGDQKYLHTTAFGLSGYSPNYAVLVVSAFSGVAPMTQEHLSLATAFDVPLIIVVTKVDISTPSQINKTIDDLGNSLAEIGRSMVAFPVTSEDLAITAVSSQFDNKVVPIFCVSSVSGEGLSLLKKYLFVLPPHLNAKERQRLEQEEAEFHIDEVYHLENRCIVGGLLCKGVITQGSSLLLGPFDDYSFRHTRVVSIHRNKVPCRVVYASQSASLSIVIKDSVIRKGMKLIQYEAAPKACNFFQVALRMLYQEPNVSRGFEATVHIGNIRQTAVIVAIMNIHKLRNNMHSSVIMQFKRHPEYMGIGSRILIRSGSTKGIGKVTQIFGENPIDPNCNGER